MCLPTFFLKKGDGGRNDRCLGIQRSHQTSKGSNEKASSFGWFTCNPSNPELLWIITTSEIEKSADPKVKSSRGHICQVIAGRAEKKCIAISNLLKPSKTVDKPTTAEINLKTVSLKDKMQAWDFNIQKEEGLLEFLLQFVNVGHKGFCLGSNSIKSLGSLGNDELFAEKKCDDNLKVQWNMGPVWENGKHKCVYEE